MLGTGITRSGYDVNLALVEPCAVRNVAYRCPYGHEFVLRFAAEADEIPVTWECRCGCAARTEVPDAITPYVSGRRKMGSIGKTHYDMLRERRTLDELEALLAERLAVLRAGSGDVAA